MKTLALLLVCFIVCVSCYGTSHGRSPHAMFSASGLLYRELTPEDKEGLGISSSHPLFGLFANRLFKEGDTIMELREENGVTYSSILSEVPSLESVQFAFVEEPFAVWLLAQRSIGESSNSEYLKLLPEHTNSPFFFPQEQWAEFSDDPFSVMLHQRTTYDRLLLQQYYERMKQIFTISPQIFAPDESTFEKYLAAYTIAINQIVPGTGNVLFPAFQFIRSPNSNVRIELVGQHHIKVIALKDFNIGDPMTYNNPLSNDDLAYKHGLVLKNNPYDCFQISVEVKNPFWGIVAQSHFNNTSKQYKTCVPPIFLLNDPIMVQFRLIEASAKDLDSLASILEGKFITLENELAALRLLSSVVKSRKPTLKERNTTTQASRFWVDFVKEKHSLAEAVEQNLLRIWNLYLDGE